MTTTDPDSGRSSGPTIKIAATEAELEAVHRFWYQVYVEEMGKDFASADHHNRRLADDLDAASSILFAADDSGRVVGSVRVTWSGLVDWPDHLRELYDTDRFDAYDRSAYSITTRLMVDPQYRGTGLVGRIMADIYLLGRERKCQFNLCYCEPSLVQLYEQMGTRRYKEHVYDPDTGLRIPLALVTEDLDHLTRVRSPFARLAAKFDNHPAAAEWFRREFPIQAEFLPFRMMDEDDLWDFFSRRLAQEETTLFQGLERDEIQAFLKSGTIIKCRPGDPVISQGEVGHELFLILKGAAEVRHVVEKRHYRLATFGQGQIFGEMAFVGQMPRTASVIALTDLEVMAINQAFMRKIMARHPRAAAKVLLNLSLILAERLKITTRGWVRTYEPDLDICN